MSKYLFLAVMLLAAGTANAQTWQYDRDVLVTVSGSPSSVLLSAGKMISRDTTKTGRDVRISFFYDGESGTDTVYIERKVFTGTANTRTPKPAWVTVPLWDVLNNTILSTGRVILSASSPRATVHIWIPGPMIFRIVKNVWPWNPTATIYYDAVYVGGERIQ